MNAGDIYLYSLQQPPDLYFQRIFRKSISFGKTLDHDPRNSIANFSALLIHNDHPNVGEYDCHFLIGFILSEGDLFVFGLKLLKLQRGKFVVNEFNVGIDVAQILGLDTSPGLKIRYLKVSVTFLKTRSYF